MRRQAESREPGGLSRQVPNTPDQEKSGTVPVMALGQVGYKFTFGVTVVYIDPYLSNYVALAEGPELQRLFPAPITPGSVTDADWVLITHEHIDHCDPQTLMPLSAASSQARFVCPAAVWPILRQMGIAADRVIPATEQTWVQLGSGLQLTAVPAAHPTLERDEANRAKRVGYVLDYQGRRFYHAGDTSVAEESLARLKELSTIDVAFLPVNERNFFKERRGIIGNMTIREAFGVAEEIGARVLVPTHWDMFAPNSVAREEIELLYRLLAPRFELAIYPTFL